MNLYFSIDYKDNDMQRLQWLTENYSDKNISSVTKMKICSFLDSIQFKKLEDIEKAISQDIKKMLLTAKKIHDYSLEFRKTPLFVANENGEAELFYDEKRDSLQINMEFYIYKYRVIIEYIMRILDLVIDMDEKNINN